MKAIIVFEQLGSKSVGIYEDENGYLALTFSASKVFKTLKGAKRWMAARGYQGPDA